MAKKGTIVCPASEGDTSDVLKLWALFEKEDERVQPEFLSLSRNFKRELRKYASDLGRRGDSTFIVAKVNGRCIGFANVRIENYPKIFKKAKIGSVNDLFIMPKYRKSGVGSRVLKCAENWLKSKRVRYILLQASSRLDWLSRMYEDRGYNEYEKSYFKKI
ncbi:MAG: GNAT family N-acetyltransferase [Candidatus Micrarchaeales archaeon]|nr:GNAT family N-acetyltransferase [Candidatus Micrarchaeales archaeon]